MAKKNTKSAGRKPQTSQNKNKSGGKGKKAEAVQEQTHQLSFRDFVDKWGIPFRFFSASVFFVVFVLLLLTFLAPGGVFFNGLENLLFGLIGRIGFFVSIPSTLYLFIIHAFSKNRPVRMRTVSMLVFIPICAGIAHILSGTVVQNYTLAGFGKLYTDGVAGISGGISGGLFGGFIAQLIALLCGKAALVFLIPAALLTLLAGMQITIPSIVRAVRNRQD